MLPKTPLPLLATAIWVAFLRPWRMPVGSTTSVRWTFVMRILPSRGQARARSRGALHLREEHLLLLPSFRGRQTDRPLLRLQHRKLSVPSLTLYLILGVEPVTTDHDAGTVRSASPSPAIVPSFTLGAWLMLPPSNPSRLGYCPATAPINCVSASKRALATMRYRVPAQPQPAAAPLNVAKFKLAAHEAKALDAATEETK